MVIKKAGSVISILTTALPFASAETVASELGRNAAITVVGFFDQLGLTTTNLSMVLLGILLWIVTYSITVQLFGGSTSTGRIASFIVSIIFVVLTFIVLPEGFVEAIVLQYGAAGGTILAVIPFIVLLYFSIWITKSILISRVIWIAYIMTYLSIFVYKIGTLQAGNAAWYEWTPYVAAIIAGLIVFFGMRWIRHLVFKGHLEDLDEKGEQVADRGQLLHKLQRQELEGSYGVGGGTSRRK